MGDGIGIPFFYLSGRKDFHVLKLRKELAEFKTQDQGIPVRDRD